MDSSSKRRYMCNNQGCIFSTTSRYSFLRHRCKQNKKQKTSQAFSFAPGIQTSNDTSSLPSNDLDTHLSDDPPSVDFHDADKSVGEDSYPLSPGQEIVKEFSALVADNTDQNTRKALERVIELISDDRFDLQVFRDSLPSITACSRVHDKVITENINNAGFQKDLATFHFNGEDHNGFFFYRDPVSLLHKQITTASATNNIHYNPSDMSEQDHKTHPLQTNYFKELHNKRKMEIMQSSDLSVRWSSGPPQQSFIAFLQVFTDKTVTTLKANGMVAHAVHVTLLNLDKHTRRSFIQNGLTIVGFLPCTTTDKKQNRYVKQSCATNTDDGQHFHMDSVQDEVQVEDKLIHTSSSHGRLVKLGLIQDAWLRIMKPLLDATNSGFPVGPMHGVTWNCFPCMASYCCDIPEAKDISGVRHNLSTALPCHRCMVSMEDIEQLHVKQARTIQQTRCVRNQVQVYETNSQRPGMLFYNCRTTPPKSAQSKTLLDTWSLNPLQSILETITEDYPGFISGNVYDLFTFEPLHNLHLGISKLLKTMLYEFIGTFRSKRLSTLRACNSVLRQMERDSQISGLHVDFSTKESSTQLNGIFLSTGLRGMLEGKDYRNLDYVFPFVSAYVDRFRGMHDDPSLTRVSRLYSDLLFTLFEAIQQHGLSKHDLESVQTQIRLIKQISKDLFSPVVSHGLYTLKFHLLDHLVLDLERYTSLDFLDASPYEYYNTHIKQGYRLGSKRKATALEETVQKLQDKVPATIPSKCNQNPSNQLSTQLLVREGFTSTQRELKELVNKLGSGKEDITQYNSKLQTELLTAMNPRDVHVFSNLLSEELATHNINVVDDNINITVVKSGYIDSYSVPSLNDYDEKTNKVRFTQVPSNQTTRKRVFATSSFGPSKLQRQLIRVP